MLAAPTQGGTTKSLFANPNAGPDRRLPRKRALIVNCFIDEYRRTSGSPHRVPRAMGPPFLAGALAREAWDIRLYNEQYSGTLSDSALLGWPDLLVLTGLTVSFDRMMQLTAYARSSNPKVVVAAGGPPVHALPRRAAEIFDYACTGDLEELQDVVRDAFGRGYVAETLFPRFDLPYGRGMIGYVESSRNCNFRCSFCSLTGEKGSYLTYDLDLVRRQILACGKKQICFIDNNFYGNDRDFFEAKVALCRELVEDDAIDGWSCLVTGDFFARPDNLALVGRSGCKILFSGIESFSQETLRRYNKRQNTIVPQVEMVRGCLEAGVVFAYGIMLDPTTRRLDDLRGEIEFVVATPEITLPAYFTLAIPLLGTPYFQDCLSERRFFPNTRLRNLDGVTLTMQPRDHLGEVLSFLKDLPSLRGFRKDALRRTGAFAALRGAPADRPDLHRVRGELADPPPARPADADLLRPDRAPRSLLHTALPGRGTLPGPFPADHDHRRRRRAPRRHRRGRCGRTLRRGLARLELGSVKRERAAPSPTGGRPALCLKCVS